MHPATGTVSEVESCWLMLGCCQWTGLARARCEQRWESRILVLVAAVEMSSWEGRDDGKLGLV